MGYGLSILFMCISAAIAIVLPIAAALYLNKKYNTSWKATVVGVLIFIVFQLLTRFQLLGLWQKTNWYTYNSVVNPWSIYLIAGFTAGIFENVGRFIGFKFFLKDKLEWKNGIAYGIGHGGIEAVLLAGIPFINLIVTSLINGTTVYNFPGMYLLGGIERIFAMTLHVALSLVVLYGVKNKKNRYLLYAILLHGIVDSSIGFVKNTILLEAWVAVFAAAVLFFIIRKIKKSSSESILA
ncbi:YhfC family intramembrane metalloprotease [Clostridium sp. YIM B02515]|uniref:YhfC family intramembrane metalloprotease n=1 Tax=Clostridium rhizosphaerae TaxID=2803861 RepID=A0ABS1TAZ0_9CLOT|nr:YhfC family glutamic-type intramembrane protease [Clostridium rhizosphaerae]MBL4936528.1 YhfC family intramembrane metalloprotease [Clostridium rhizosphaerae]